MRFQARGFLYKLFGQFDVASDTGCGGGGGGGGGGGSNCTVGVHCGTILWGEANFDPVSCAT